MHNACTLGWIDSNKNVFYIDFLMEDTIGVRVYGNFQRLCTRAILIDRLFKNLIPEMSFSVQKTRTCELQITIPTHGIFCLPSNRKNGSIYTKLYLKLIHPNAHEQIHIRSLFGRIRSALPICVCDGDGKIEWQKQIVACPT